MFSHGAMFEWILFVLGNACFAVYSAIFYGTVRRSNRIKSMTDPIPSASAILFVESNVIGDGIRLMVSLICALSGWVAISFPPPPGVFSVSAIWKAQALIVITVLVLLSGMTARWYQVRIAAYSERRDRRSTDTHE